MHVHRFVSSAFLLAMLSSLAVAQLERVRRAEGRPERTREECARQIWTGRVCLPGGLPAAGATIVTSAGGRAVAGADGSFELDVLVPLDVESLELVAHGTGERAELFASVRVAPSASAASSVGLLVLAPSPAWEPRWRATFGEQPGVKGEELYEGADALAVFDDGSGPALYLGGEFWSAGGVAANNIARWDGSRWSALGAGISGDVYAMTVFDDGGGPALYVGGRGLAAGGSDIARWDGTSWSPLGSGVQGHGGVYAMAVFDDGSGPALYAGGGLDTAGGLSALRIARWDGSSWSSLGSGVGDSVLDRVYALEVFDDGTGAALYAGGDFDVAGSGLAANGIAKWDGSTWSALGSGLTGHNFSSVRALEVFDDGSGPELVAGGLFLLAGGVSANRIAKWNGSSWSALGSGVSTRVDSLAVFDDGGGAALHVGGNFVGAGGMPASHAARWDGSSWSALGSGTNQTIRDMEVFDDGDGAVLYTCGDFETAGGLGVSYVAGWSAAGWSTLGKGLSDSVLAATQYDDGSGSDLYVAGAFTSAGGLAANRVARWNGGSWSVLGSGMNADVRVLREHDDGGGPALYAGGSFTSAGGLAADRIARWDGTSWSALGAGMNGDVSALAVHDDGGGPALYAGGAFTQAGGTSANRIASWNGTSWSAVGSGMNGDVLALTVHDDGGGPALYAGGKFTLAGGTDAKRIARWDGSAWSTLGSGFADGALFTQVDSFAVFDDGSGPALYAGGNFSRAGGIAAYNVARWDGSSWTALGSVVLNTPVVSLAVFDDGSGPALYAGMNEVQGIGGEWGMVVRWNGTSWSVLEETDPFGYGSVAVLEGLERDSGPFLLMGGSFASTAFGASNLAEWSRKGTRKMQR